MNTIVRIEHPKDGIGIFQRDDEFRLTNIDLQNIGRRHNDKFKTPWDDGLDLERNGREWFCGYKSIEQIQSWIKKSEFRKLISHGYKILLIKANECQVGDDQLIFTKESVVTTEDITSLFK